MANPIIAEAARRVRPWLRIVLVLLALSGAMISAVLVRLGMPSDASPTAAGAAITHPTVLGVEVCAPTDRVDCGHVLNSRWARFGPLPTALLGVAYFAVLAVWFAAVGLPNHAGRRWHWLPLIQLVLGAASSAAFLYVMAFRLPVWCTWCAAAHGINLAMLLLAALAWPRRPAEDQASVVAAYPSHGRAMSVIGACVAVALLLVVGGHAYRTNVAAWQCQRYWLAVTNDLEYVVWRYQQAPVQDVPVLADDGMVGSADAPSTVVVFSDFECPKCRDFFLRAEGLVRRFPDELRIVFKHYPMARQCNPHVTGDYHYFSCAAARAAEAARLSAAPRQVLEFHRLLYANMSRLDEARYEILAKQAGIDDRRFAAALGDQAGRDRLAEDVALAGRLGVEGTPAIFLNGRRLPTWKIVTADVEAKLDVDQTVALWERLLGAAPRQHGSP